ncbi:MAG: DNA-3-methyladenine glycosylase [Bacteroidia bacterium]|nr:DNA-3-methyladenine glycosylase [Bacteroidia bacterium]
MEKGTLLPHSFYRRTNTVQVAKDLLGKVLVTCFDGVKTAGIIVETEAYLGAEDRACHAWNYRRTARTEPMFSAGGIAYVYLIYGVHPMFNVVTHLEGEPHAVLVRGLEPLEGVEVMLQRRKKSAPKSDLTAGPGALAKALGMAPSHSGISLLGEEIFILDQGLKFSENEVLISPRVGVDYAGEHAAWPLRFRVKNNPWTSPAK